MRSLRSRHIWLIQPNDALPPVTPLDNSGGDSVWFSPAWDLLCLQAFVLGRTGHTCELIDTRLHDNIASALGRLGDPAHTRSFGVAVVYATVHNLGPVGSITSQIRENFPQVQIALCGPYVASFPETINLIPHVDYGLAGDAEVILRNLLDFADIEHRLRLVPGLILPNDERNKSPSWVPSLNALSLPEWQTTRWSHYQPGYHHSAARVAARLSRGNPGTPADIASPNPSEPLRVWSMGAMARLVQKCPGHGISEVFFNDPPGFWSRDRLMEWCRHLDAVRNSQPWAFQMIPRDLTEEEITGLSNNVCRRIELIIPSCRESQRKIFDFTLTIESLNRLIDRLRAFNIHPQLIHWVQGPGEAADESEDILTCIKSLHADHFSIYPFPFHHDSVLFRNVMLAGGNAPPLTEWLSWAQNSERGNMPVALWRGHAGLAQCSHVMSTIRHRVIRNPWLRIIRLANKLRLKSPQLNTPAAKQNGLR